MLMLVVKQMEHCNSQLSLKASGQEGQQSDHLHSSSYGRASRAGSVNRSDKEDSGLVVQVKLVFRRAG